MPTSPSARRGTEGLPPAKRSRIGRPLIALIVLAVVTVAVFALPASLVARFLPPAIHADDFSGSLWHGSAGKFAVQGRDAGAIEWRIHPWSLLALTLSSDVHWVKVGFLADGQVDIGRHGLTARDVRGGGPIEDLSNFGVAAGWHGACAFQFSDVKLAFMTDGSARMLSAIGELSVSNLASPRFAEGTDLGGYVLELADGAITPDADAAAELRDTGGPIELQAVIHYSVKEHAGLLSGTVKARADASPALRRQVDNLSQLHAPDARGRIPVELEFAL